MMRIGICISGGGSTMERVIKACQSHEIGAEVGLVIASQDSCGGIAKAQALKVPTEVIKLHRDFRGNEIDYGRQIIRRFHKHNVDLITLLGSLVKLPDCVIAAWPDMVINQHPGPLDPGRLGFGGQGMHGLKVHEAVLRFSRAINRPFQTEATVHRVTKKYDDGPLLGTLPMDILPEDTAKTLAERLLPLEHQLVVDTIHRFTRGEPLSFKRSSPLILSEEEEIFHQIIKRVTTLR